MQEHAVVDAILFRLLCTALQVILATLLHELSVAQMRWQILRRLTVALQTTTSASFDG